MLIWLLNTVFRVADFVLGLALIVLPVCYVLRFLLPGNKYVLLAGKYLDGWLSPVSSWIKRKFTWAGGMGVDVSPMVLWAALLLARWVLRLLRGILL